MTDSRHSFVRVSRNRKTGPIPVTTTDARTCPPSCGLFAECYAKAGHVAIHWRKLAKIGAGISFADLLRQIRALPGGTLWRHNVAGDLPGAGESLDIGALARLARANRGRRGFTYTHKPATPENVAAIRDATRAGFTINLSADNGARADILARHNLPVVVVIPADAPKVTRTPLGRKIVHCPAENSDRITCANCGLCANANRDYMIGFKPKGVKKRATNLIAQGVTAP